MFGSGGTGFGGFGQQNQAQQQQPGQTGGLFGAQQQQQPATGTGFGGFGAQPSTTFGGGNTGGSLFGQAAQQPQQPAQSGFTFGQSTNNATATPFGQQNNQAKPATFGGFGASTNTTTPAAGGATGFGGFGSSTSASPFGAPGGNTFGAKPATSLFGQPQQQATNTFGQPAQGGGLFGAAGGLGAAAQIAPMPTQGTSNPPYDLKPQPEGPPDTPYDHDKKTPQLLNYTSITCMKPYRAASLEELRLQDYEQGRKTGNGGMTAPGGFGQSTAGGGFGAPAQPGSLFGQQQPQQQNTFGSGGLFGQSTQQGQQPGQSTGGLFGGGANTGSSLFGQQQQQQQPQTGGLFGQTQNTQQQQQPSTGFGFGASTQQNNTTGGGFSFGQNNTQQQNKPAGGLFGGFNQSAAPASSGFSFGGTNNQTQQPATSGFGASSTGFGFGSTAANANQPKPGGLFGAPATSSAPTFGGFGATSGAAASTDNKPAFSFGGGGFGSSAAPGQQASAAAPSGGLFGGAQPTTTSQPTSGFSFGAPNTTGAAAGTGGGLFGGQQNQQSTGGFGAGGGLFGNKPATTGGLFGQPQQQQQQQPATGGFGFGASNTNTGTTGGLFGNTQQNKPAGGGLFGNLGSNNNQQQSTTGGGLFGSTQNNTNTLGSTGGGLFGGGQTAGNTGGSSLFGNANNNNNNQQTGNTGGLGGGLFGSSTGGGTGFNLGGQSNAGGGFGGSLFGNSQMQNNNQQAPNLSVSLNSNPYGTDALFGGQAGALNGSSLAGSMNNTSNGLNSQPHLPFNVSLSRSTVKKQPPIVPPFRPSSRNSIRITKLRGSTPGFRESTPGREGTPGPSASLFSSSPAPSSYQRLSSPSPSIFRGLSDDLPRSQRESSIPAATTPLPPQAFVSRPSVKRLVLDDNGSRSSTTGLGRSNSLFGSRASSTTPAPAAYNRNGTPAGSHAHFSPALETAFGSAQGGRANDGDSSLTSSMFQARKGPEETPSKGNGGADTSLPALTRSASSKPSKEDALLPLDYWTLPALSELREWSHAELQEVEGFVVGRKGYGQVAFDAPVDLTSVGELGIIPGGLVILRTKECMVYPDEEECFDEDTGKERDGVQPGFEPRKVPGGKASRGSGLNVPAIVKLEKCWPYDRSTRLPVKDEEHIRVKQLVNKLKRRTDAHFVGFEADTGTWTFKVDHFSRYGLDETDEDATDDEGTAEKGGKGKTGAQADGGAKKGGMRQSDDDDEDDDLPPPTRALGEESDEGDDEDEEIGASQHTPRASTQFRSTPVPVSQTQGSTAPSTVASQPWAASLGLEPRRVQVMQASFFGSNDRSSSHEPASGASRAVKQSRLASPSFGSSQAGAVASRASFLGPMAEDAGVASKAKPVSTSIERPFGPPLSSTIASTRPRKFSRLELPSSSIADGGHGIAIDAGLSMGRSFRVGWGPNGLYAHSGSKPTAGEAADSVSTVKLSKMRIFPAGQEKKEQERMEKLLQTQLQHSIVEGGDEGEVLDGEQDCPAVFPQPTLRFKDFIAPLEGLADCHYETAIFKLGAALFDEVDTKLGSSLDHQRELNEEVLKIRRRNNVANWIRWYTGESIRGEIRSQAASTGKNAGEQSIFSHLSGGFFEEACKQSIDVGDVRLATLIAQASSGGDEEEYRMDIADQLSVWRSSGVDAFLSTEYRRIMELLSGNVLWSRGNGKREEGEAVRDLKIAAGLDWVRTFALFLHFDSRFDSSLSEVLERYESNVGGEAEIVPPLPPYLDKEIRPGSQRFRDAVRTGDYHRDLLFHLLKVFCDPDYHLENVLQPLTGGASKLSFSLAFHASLLLSKVLFKRDFSDRVDLGIEDVEMAQEINIQGNSGKSDQLCVDFAMQLETLGLWKWSAFILLHLELKEGRRKNVQALLARHADDFDLPSERGAVDGDDQIVPFLVSTLRIPIEWLYVAKADRAASQLDKWLEYKYSLCSLDRSRAHDIAVRFLAPEGIIRHDFEFMLQLFAPFQGDISSNRTEADAAGAQDVAGWARGGQVYIDYIAICRSLPYLLNSSSSSSGDKMQGFSSSFLATSGANTLNDKDGQSTIEKCRQLAERIPKLMADIRQLFDGLQSNVTVVVAQTQMITSLFTCVRMLKNSPLFRHFDLSELADVQGLSAAAGSNSEGANDETTKEVAVEVENLQFFANDYCSMLVGAA